MGWNIKYNIGLVFLLISSFGFAQDIKKKIDAERIIESVVESLQEETDAAIIIEDLYYFKDNPLNINTATENDLSRLHLLNAVQIDKIIKYRKEYGKIYSIYELNSIDNLNPQLLRNLEPFLFFGKIKSEDTSLKNDLKYGKHQLLMRTLGTIQKPQGYSKREDGTTPYEGNRFRYYTRYKFNANNKIKAGFTAEKDPGETFFTGSNEYGFDFYSAFLSFKVNSVVKNITVGDFLIRSGQGLVLWQGYTMGKNIYSLDAAKYNQGVRGYTSVDENNFFRGVSTTVELKNVELTGFYSNKKIDGNIDFQNDSTEYFTSRQSSGYHRTETEIEDEKSVRDINTGLVASWQINNLIVGSTFHYQKFDKSLIKSDQLYNQFLFTGDENYSGGVDYLYSRGKYQFYGEVAISKSKGKAYLQGVNIYLNDFLQVNSLFRHYDKDYHAFWSNGFSEKSKTNNETGFFLGVKLTPFKYIRLTGYTDFYKVDWIDFKTIMPATGWDLLLQSEFLISEKLDGYIRYKNELKETKIKSTNKYIQEDTQTQKMRFHLSYSVNEKWRLQTRLEYAKFKNEEKEDGFLLFEDVSCRPSKILSSLSARLTYFNISDYDARIYAYENDLLYTFSIPAFFDEGIRGYLNMKFSISKNVDLWLKFAHTNYFNRDYISSGHDKIDGDNKSDIRFQLRIKL